MTISEHNGNLVYESDIKNIIHFLCETRKPYRDHNDSRTTEKLYQFLLG